MPGLGCGGTSGDDPGHPHHSRSSSAFTKKSLAGRGRTGSLPCPCRRSGICCAPCSRLSMQSLWCRRWWNVCQTCSSSSTRSFLIPIRKSKCPRSCLRTSLCARFCVIRSWLDSWWKCRRSYPVLPCCFCRLCSRLRSRTLSFQLLVDNPVPRPGGAGGPPGLPRGQSSTAFSEQIAEFADLQVEVFQIFIQSRVPQRLLRFPLDKLVKGVLALFPGRKKVRRSRAPRGRNWVVPWPNTGCGFFSLLLRSKSGAFLVCSSGSPSYPVAWSRCWCRLCTVAACESWRLQEEFPLPRAPRRAGVRCIRDACFAWFNNGYMFCERLLANFTYFPRVVHSDPWCSSPFRRMEKCAQLMLRVAVSLRAVRTLNLDIISASFPCDGVG